MIRMTTLLCKGDHVLLCEDDHVLLCKDDHVLLCKDDHALAVVLRCPSHFVLRIPHFHTEILIYPSKKP